MRHHGKIEEDRRGLAIIVGLLTGIIGGAILASPTARAGDAEGGRTALSEQAAAAVSGPRSSQ